MRQDKPLVALIANGGIDHTGTHRANLYQIKAFLELDGFAVHVFWIRLQADMQKLVRALHSHSYHFVHCEQGHYLGLAMDGELLFDKLELPVFTQLRDHWFYPWVWRNLKSLPNKATIFHTSELYAQVASRVNGSHVHTVHTSQLYKKRETDYLARPINIFYSGTCRSIADATSMASERLEGTAIERIVDECAEACRIPDWVWEIEFLGDDRVRVGDLELDLPDYYRFFELARSIVRSNILNVLAKHDATMFVKGGWTPVKDAKASFSNKPISFPESNFLASHSACVFSDQATFRNEIGERVATGLEIGTRVIARANTGLAQYVSQGKNLLVYDSLESLSDVLDACSGMTLEKSDLPNRPNFGIQRYIGDIYDTLDGGS